MEKRHPRQYELLKKELNEQGINKINYEDLLWTEEWLSFRINIIHRDNYTCTSCGTSRWVKMATKEYDEVVLKSKQRYNIFLKEFVDYSPEDKFWKTYKIPSNLKLDNKISLEVHHKYYIWDHLPWEYEFEALTTLCPSCHRNEHDQQPIIYTNNNLTEIKKLNTCKKCDGVGYIKEYNHIHGGICFTCGGMGGF